MDPETVDLAAMERSNKVSWARFIAECDRLQSLLAAQNLSIDYLGALLSKLDPTATSQVGQITRSLRETLSMREKGREYFQASSADSAPLMPSRLRRLNRV